MFNLLIGLVFAQELISTPSAAISPTPTIIIDPSSGLYLSEISPTTDTEWIEIFNNNDNTVRLTKWKLQTETLSRNIPENIEINSKSYYIFEASNFLSNSDPKSVKLINQSESQIDISQTYIANLSNTLSWSKQSDNSWCQSNPTKSQNNNSCFVPSNTSAPATQTPIPPTNTPVPPTSVPATPTSTPKPTTTPTIKPTPTLIVKSSATPTEDPTDLPTIIETEDAAFYLTTPSPSPTDSEILGIQDFVASPAAVSTKNKLPKNLIPSIFIGTGTALLLTPLILSKLKYGQN